MTKRRPRDPSPVGPEWVEFGGQRIFAVDFTEGGAPIGLTEEELEGANERAGIRTVLPQMNGAIAAAELTKQAGQAATRFLPRRFEEPRGRPPFTPLLLAARTLAGDLDRPPRLASWRIQLVVPNIC